MKKTTKVFIKGMALGFILEAINVAANPALWKRPTVHYMTRDADGNPEYAKAKLPRIFMMVGEDHIWLK